MINYSLGYNNLTKDGTYVAYVQNIRSKSIEGTIGQMTDEGSILTDVESNTVIHSLFKHLAKGLKIQGECLKSKYFDMSLSIKGVFEDEDDIFDPERHQLVLKLTPGEFLTNVLREIELKKVNPNAVAVPTIKSFLNILTDSTTEMNPGGIIELKGEFLSVDKEVADEGVFLINKADNSETKLTKLHNNKPSVVQVVTPAGLTSGTYYIEVRNRPNGVKSLRSGRLTTEVNVA